MGNNGLEQTIGIVIGKGIPVVSGMQVSSEYNR